MYSTVFILLTYRIMTSMSEPFSINLTQTQNNCLKKNKKICFYISLLCHFMLPKSVLSFLSLSALSIMLFFRKKTLNRLCLLTIDIPEMDPPIGSGSFLFFPIETLNIQLLKLHYRLNQRFGQGEERNIKKYSKYVQVDEIIMP